MKKPKFLLPTLGLLSLGLIVNAQSSQCVINRNWAFQNANPVTYDYVGSALTSGGDLVYTCNHSTGGNSKIFLNRIQSNGSLGWQQSCPTAPTNNNYGVDTRTDANGNVYIIGAYHNGSNYDYTLAKYSSSGTMVWQKYYNGTGASDDIPTAIELDASGNIYVTGTSYGIGTFTDFATIKYDNNGNVLWTKRYDFSSKPEAATDLLVDASGNVYVTGGSASSLINSDITTLKYNSGGTLVNTYRHTFAGNGFDVASEMSFDNSGNIVITGTVESASNKGFITLKLNISLVAQWNSLLNTGLSEEGYGISADASGNILSIGYANNASGGSDVVVNKYSSSGVLSWRKVFPNPNQSQFAKGRKIKIANGNIYFIADMVMNTTKDFATISLDVNGNIRWAEYYNSPNNGNDLPKQIQINNDKIFVTGVSSVGTSQEVRTVKYTETQKPLSAVQSPSGDYNQNEILIRFDANSLDLTAIDNKGLLSGPLSTFVKPNVIQNMTQKYNLSWGDLKAFKVFPRLNRADSISISRIGEMVKVPDFWTTISVFLPAGHSEPLVADCVMTIKPDIRYAHVNALLYPQNVPNDPFIPQQEGLIPTANFPNAHINMDAAWNFEVGKTNIKAGVLDDPIYWGNPDFGNGTFAGSKIADGWDYVNGVHISTVTSPTNSHGTACAGIIGALRNNGIGVAGIAGGDVSNGNTGVQLYSLAISSGGSFTTSSNQAQALVEGAVSTSAGGFGLHVMSASYGGFTYVQLEDDALTTVWENACTFVAARGNYGHQSNPIVYPACHRDEKVISVGASSKNGDHKNQTNGDVGQFAAWESSYGNNMDIIAPGCTDVVSSTQNPSAPFSWSDSLGNADYYTFAGTSAATPHVAGVAALMHSRHNTTTGTTNNLAPEDIEYMMQNFVTDICGPVYPAYPVGYDNENGYGRIDAFQCVGFVNYPVWEVRHSVGTGVTTPSDVVTPNVQINIPVGHPSNLAPGNYFADKHQITNVLPCGKNPTQSMVGWWPRFGSTLGTDGSNPISYNDHYFGFSQTPTVLGSSIITASYETYVWFIKNTTAGQQVNQWWPCQPSQIKVGYSVHLHDGSGVGVEEESNNTYIDIYPSPTEGQTTLEVHTATGDHDGIFEIFDLAGQKLTNGKLAKSGVNTLDLSTFATGVYFVRITMNGKAITKKIIKN